MTAYVKHPSIFHLPWSDGIHSDDKVIEGMGTFVGKSVVVTEKLDGENTSLYRDHYHARSIDSGNHPSRNRAKALWAGIAASIPHQWRLCCENMTAKHSIEYSELEDYLYGFSVWNACNECLAWNDTVEWFDLIGLPTVPVLYEGFYDETVIKALYDHEKDWERSEGYVVRLARSFHYDDFQESVAKYVRRGHVQTTDHWLHGPFVENKVRNR